MARPRGTGIEYQESVKTVATRLKIKKWANRLAPKALKILEETMIDPKSSAVVKKGIAERILAIQDMLYAEIGGVAKPTVDEKKIKAEKAKKDAEENGGVPELVSLKFDGVDYGEEPTGTD